MSEIEFKRVWQDCMVKAVLPVCAVLLLGLILKNYGYSIGPVVFLALPVAWWSSRYILKNYKCTGCGYTLVSGDVLLYPKCCPKCGVNLLGKNT